MKIVISIILGVTLLFANALSLVDDSVKYMKGANHLSELDNAGQVLKVGKLNKVMQQHLVLSKTENIQDLMALAIKEDKVSIEEQFKYIEAFKNLESGDKLLLKCLKSSECNLGNFTDLMQKSPLHVQIALKYPNMTLTHINHKIGSINENIMNKYFQSTGWNKIEGEVGRNGIDGLFIKKENGVIVDVLVVESKYNKSGLQHTQNGQQMTQQWILSKIENLQKKYPEDESYNVIKRHVENNNHRALLWNLKTENDNLIVSLKKVNDDNGKAIAQNIAGNEKMKINYNGNQEISIKSPNNDFHKQVVDWYKKELIN